MAEVYLALARGPQGFKKLVVIKKLRAEMADQAVMVAMLLDEARLAARLLHPNVVQTLEVGEHEGVPFIAMEYLAGQSLDLVIRATLKSPQRPGPAFWGRLVSDALSGLHYAHELRDFDGTPLNIIHRDVSPHNLFVTYEGEVKLVDFGIAKATLSSETTEAGTVKGKLSYMAPEQAVGQPMDRRADIFAMGVVLWELLASRRLWRPDTHLATLHKLLHEPIPSLQGLVPGIDPRLDAVCSRALEKDPARRYPTAAHFREELEAALEGLQPRAPRRDEVARTLQSLFAVERAKVEERIQQMLTQNSREELDVEVTVEGEPPTAVLPSLLTPTSRKQPTNPYSSTASSLLANASANALGAGVSARASNTELVARPSATVQASVPAGGAVSTLEARASVNATAERVKKPVSTGRWVAGLVASIGVIALLVVLGGGGLSRKTEGPPAPVKPAPIPPAVPVDPAQTGEVVLRICGSNTIGAELMPALVEAFLKQKGATQVTRLGGARADLLYLSAQRAGEAHPQLIRIDAQGSATAFTGLMAHTCELGMSSRPIKEEEAEKLKAEGMGDVRSPGGEHVLALDGIAVIVHPANPVKSLTVEQLRAIFSGKINRWSEVGGADGPIVLYARDNKSGTYDTFQHLVLQKEKLLEGAKRYEDSNKLSDEVAGDPAGIGFIGLAYIHNAKVLAVASGEAPATFPSSFTVNTESYPLSRRLHLYTPLRSNGPLVSSLLNFALSPEGQQVVRAQGFVDLSVAAQTVEVCTHCPPKYRQLIKGAKRLSLDFHFRSGSDELDTRGQRDLERLVLFLRGHADERLLLLGFSDAEGDAAVERQRSLERAKQVGAELSARGVHPAEIRGFGSELPVAPNTDRFTRERNRRVEVWIDG